MIRPKSGDEEESSTLDGRSYDVIVVGAGFAGAATAAALVEAGVSRVLVVERESTAGVHSSGRNAGMVRRAVEDPAITPLTVEGAAAITDSGVPFRRTGSYLLSARGHVPRESLRGFDSVWIDAATAAERVPFLATYDSDVLETPSDGIVEVHALLHHFLDQLRAGGGDVIFRAESPTPVVDAGRIVGLKLDGATVRCRHLVVATGAWGAEWGSLVGAPIVLVPKRRHIVCTEAPNGAPPWDWPWVWDLESQFYFRPESGGLLWSPCDELDQPACSALPDPEAPQWLAEKLEHRIPAAVHLCVGHLWAGHRTFTPDRRFLLGPDPRVPGWHWAVGLGGHGVTVAAAVGRRVASGIVGDSQVETEHAFRQAVLQGDGAEATHSTAAANQPSIGAGA